ncbi:MAG: DUF1330 domain-containing protein [Candidatus Tectomicrobia bacterium]|uniref:DUF1330 domain-containing protein n=1 Tax=Tectimicrobiota bacterium TaxID=2528274 RepID=A0A932GSJ4_UNCTE|nr:DUF1330 domain-containing protein [Candidatus Tectomicrobia bacterium]
MAVYMIVDIDVKDPSAYERYKAEVPALIRNHGGEYLARGGNCQVLEGDWRPSRLVLSRFPDKESVRAFFSDPEYQPLKELRHRVAKTDIVVVEGL